MRHLWKRACTDHFSPGEKDVRCVTSMLKAQYSKFKTHLIKMRQVSYLKISLVLDREIALSLFFGFNARELV